MSDGLAAGPGSGPAQAPGLAASIFDLDGLLVDTEPLWHEAEVTVLGGLGVPLARDDTRGTKGMFVAEVVRYWFARHPWPGPSTDQVTQSVLEEVERLVAARATLRPGAVELVAACSERGLATAVASSSPVRYITVALERAGLANSFGVICSAEHEAFGKPHPAVFLSAAAALDVPPDRCVVWEDAPAGVLAAKAARMRCVAVPDPEDRDRPEMGLADAVLASLDEVDDALWGRLGG